MNKKLFLIVDCQYDFIEGSLAVKGAKDMVKSLADYIKSTKLDGYDIALTMDWHPSNHCSFIEQDGQFPSHCVQYTKGASIDDTLLKAIYELPQKAKFYKKGLHENREEYSIFNNFEDGNALYFSLKQYDEIVVCGIAREYCVYNTIKDLVEDGACKNIVVLDKYISAIDPTDNKLDDLITKYNLKTIK